MSLTSSSTSSGSDISSMDSVNEELQSLRRSIKHVDPYPPKSQSKSQSRPGSQGFTKRGFFDFGRKSYSTNSSPLKQKVAAEIYSNDAEPPSLGFDDVEDDQDVKSTEELSEQDEDEGNDDDELDTKSLGFDPFLERTSSAAEIPIANSTILSKNSGNTTVKSKKQQSSATKSVRFNDWEKNLDEGKLKIQNDLKNKLRMKKQLENLQQYKQKQQEAQQQKGLKNQNQNPSFNSTRDLKFNFFSQGQGNKLMDNNSIRVSSSEYSATPDNSGYVGDDQPDQSISLSSPQKRFMLPTNLSEDSKKLHLNPERSGPHAPLTDQMKELPPQLSHQSQLFNHNSNKQNIIQEPIISASTDGSESLFSKLESSSLPTAKTDIESSQPMNCESTQLTQNAFKEKKNEEEVKVSTQPRFMQQNSHDTDVQRSGKFEILTFDPVEKLSFTPSRPSHPATTKPNTTPKVREDKSFSFKPESSSKFNHRKNYNLASDGSFDESYDQVDILEQSPPILPKADKSHKDAILNFDKDINNDRYRMSPSFSSSENQLMKDGKYELMIGAKSSSNGDLHKDLSIPDDVKVKVNEILETLSYTRPPFNGNKSKGDTTNDSCLRLGDVVDYNDSLGQNVNEILKLAKECDQKSNKLKIQLIKLNKQQNEHEDIVSQKNNIIDNLKKKLDSSNEDLAKLTEELNFCEQSLKTIESKFKHESEKNKDYENQLESHISLLRDCRSEIERKVLYLEKITKVISEGSTSNNLNYFEDSSNHESQILIELRKILSTLKQLKQKEKKFKNIEQGLQNEISALNQDIKFFKRENEELQNSEHSLKEFCLSKDNIIQQKDIELQKLRLENADFINEIKSREFKQSDLTNQLENERFRARELEAQVLELQNEKKNHDRKSHEMNEVLSDQLLIVKEVQSEFESQTSTINNLEEQCKSLRDENENLTANYNQSQVRISTLKSELENSRIQVEQIIKNNEESERRFTTQLKLKSDEIHRSISKINELETVEANLISEIKETRSKLSTKISQCTAAEKKCQVLSKNFKDSEETNRSIRSELLKNNGLRQELSRTLLGLCISIVRGLEGIIDNDSLSSVREGLKSFTDERELEKLHDISSFIEEAVALVVREHWSLTKRLSNSQKGSLSNSSLSALQNIIESQNLEVRQLQGKITYYDSVFRKIHIINSRQKTRQYSSASTTSNRNGNGGKRVRVQSSRDYNSDDSLGTVKTSRTNFDNDEIKRLLVKVSKHSRGIPTMDDTSTDTAMND